MAGKQREVFALQDALNADFARVLRDGAGNIVGIQEPFGKLFSPSPKLLDWGDIPDPSALPPFAEIWVRPSTMLTGAYRTDIPVLFINNESQTILKPAYEQSVYAGLGSAAAPLLAADVSSGNEKALITNVNNVPTLPAGLMYKGMRIKIRTLITRNTVGNTAIQTFHRISDANNLLGDIISNQSTALTAGRPAYVESELRVHTLGDRGNSGGNARAVVNKDSASSLPSSAVGSDINGTFTSTELVYLSLSYKNTGTDAHDFIWFDVRIAP